MRAKGPMFNEAFMKKVENIDTMRQIGNQNTGRAGKRLGLEFDIENEQAEEIQLAAVNSDRRIAPDPIENQKVSSGMFEDENEDEGDQSRNIVRANK